MSRPRRGLRAGLIACAAVSLALAGATAASAGEIVDITPSPTPSATPTDTASPTPTDTATATPAATDTASATDLAADVAAACDPAQAPDGTIGLGTDAAQQAADTISECAQAQSTAEAAGVTVQAQTGSGSTGGMPLVSSVPVTLSAKSQTLTGLAYDGIVTVQTDKGPLKALKLRADSVTIEGFRQEVALPLGTSTVKTGRTVTVSGNVELYVLSQTGKVFGLLPLTISVDSPPPLILPFLIFTDVEAKIAFLSADRLKVPAAQLSAG